MSVTGLLKSGWITLAVLALCTMLVAKPEKYYQIEQQTPQSLVLTFSFPEPKILSIEGDAEHVAVSIPGLIDNYSDGLPLLPVFSDALIVPEGKVRLEILQSKTEKISDKGTVIYRIPGESQSGAKVRTGISPFPQTPVLLQFAGLFRDYRIMGLQVYPIQWSGDGLTYYKELKVKVHFGNPVPATAVKMNVGEKELLNSVALNGDQAAYFSPIKQNSAQTARSVEQEPAGGVKFFLDKKGIYHVTGQDFLDANIDISQINPQTFRLTNRGKEIPVFISGEQDLKFDKEDFIEFWGDKNEKTFIDKYPDSYADPFSDTNVFWLSWGGKPGIRMVEESGAIKETNPARYNAAEFYRFTQHIEKNNFFERFGYGDTHKLSYTRDLWFFDSGIQAVGKKAYEFDLIYPDSASFNPVYVKAYFAGKSYTNTAHNMMLWLNDRLVGRTGNTWFNQDTFSLNNLGNSSIRTLDLHNGTNRLEVQMPALSPGVESDYVLFNWADVTYDRDYRAYDDYIEFRRPSIIYYPDNSLYQFSLVDFAKPDIEIYKKGISKIINYDLTVQQTATSKKYKVTFQDNVLTDDVEYIALTADLKLKPLLIQPEKPYDEDRPSLTLKDPSNSAEYLIITHEKFYDRVKALAEYRRQQGLKVGIVKVQDIYDEFNYGIKSPLAIQSFIKYVYYNWDSGNRLKYVVLFGDANYNYKTSDVVHEDFVPTFFYQSYKFGAVATDLPYSLVSGNDDLPDVFVGRIPASTNSEATSIIEKIKDYESNPVPGPWSNQTLFISGNDASTYEFDNLYPGRKLPAFRTQNQRLISMLLPQHYSSFKLNSVKDPNLAFDPNFGGPTDLIEYFDDGVSFMTFLGHGGGGIWADKSLFNLEDVNRLNNQGKYPFVASMTCFTGAFDNPGVQGLAQKMLLANQRGAIGVLASSGLGWLSNDYAMIWNVMRNLFEKNTPMGEAVTSGIINYYLSGEYVMNDTIVSGYNWGHSYLKYDMIHQYNLFGDPYLSLHFPAETLPISVDNPLPQRGDTLTVQVISDFSRGEGYIELSNYNNEVVSREPISVYSGKTNLKLPIPEAFPSGSGFIRAYLADQNREAAGSVQIGVDYSVIDSVDIIPPKPNAQDSVTLELAIREKEDVAKVSVLAILPEDTVKIQTIQVAPGLFRTIRKIPPTYTISTVYFYVYVTNSQGKVSRFLNNSYKVTEDRPDPFIYPGSIRFTGETAVQVAVNVGNSGNVTAQNVALSFYDGAENYNQDKPFASSIVTIAGKDSASSAVTFPLPLNRTNYSIYAAINHNMEVPDFNVSNNTDNMNISPSIFNVTPALGTTYQNASNDTLTFNGKVSFWMPPNGITESSAVILRPEEISSDYEQTGLTAIPLADAATPQMFRVKFLNSRATQILPFLLKFSYNQTKVYSQDILEGKFKLFHWDEQIKTWIQENAVIDTTNGTMTAQLNNSGYYAPFVSSDKQAPSIELTFNGRRLLKKSQVSENPELNIVLEDDSGLNILNNEIRILVDGVELSKDKMFIPDSLDQSKILGLAIYPQLDLGQHVLSIQAKDVSGNFSEKEYTLIVNDQFDLHVFGNYPNPFSDITIFSYFITSPRELDDFEVRIFTVSGRMIRRITNDINTVVDELGTRKQGYNELIWDGLDEDGNEVANGVYFALVRAKLDDQVKEEILKVAKLK